LGFHKWWIAAPFHRFNMIDPRAVNGGFGVYRDVGAVPGLGDGFGRTWANLPNLYGGSPGTRPQLFPAPDRAVALNQYWGAENPNPTAPCSNPSRPQVRPFLTQEGLTWDDGNGVVRNPIGLPITLQTFPSVPVDTQVLDARLTRLSDGALNPLCAYGSLQYWEGRNFWYQGALTGLRGWGVVVAFPHDPLTPGEAYEAYLKVRLGSELRGFTWRFSVAGQGDLYLAPFTTATHRAAPRGERRAQASRAFSLDRVARRAEASPTRGGREAGFVGEPSVFPRVGAPAVVRSLLGEGLEAKGVPPRAQAPAAHLGPLALAASRTASR